MSHINSFEKLNQLGEDQLYEIYSDLLLICKGKEMKSHEIIDKNIWIIETADCDRGSLIRHLIGKKTELASRWIPNKSITQFYSNTELIYTSKDADTGFYIKDYLANITDLVSENEALIYIENIENQLTRHDYKYPELNIHTRCEAIPSGWNCILPPPVHPNNLLNYVDEHLPPNATWVLACSDVNSAETILNGRVSSNNSLPTMQNNPSFIVLDKDRDQEKRDKPYPIGTREEVSKLIQNHIATLTISTSPNKERLITIILQLEDYAHRTFQQQKSNRLGKHKLPLVLAKAENRWRKFILDEKRLEKMSMQLNFAVHPIAKIKLISKMNREAQINTYLHQQLIPRIQNFFEAQLLELTEAVVDLEAKNTKLNEDPLYLTSDPMLLDSENQLRSGIIFALPILAFNLSSLIALPGDYNELLAISQLSTLESSGQPTSIDVGNLPWIPESLEHGLNSAANGIVSSFSPILSQLSEQLGSISKQIIFLTKIMFTAQIGAILAGTVGAVILIQSHLSLVKTEQMLMDMLEEIEDIWPQINLTLQKIIKSIDGNSDPSVEQTAREILDRLKKIKPLN